MYKPEAEWTPEERAAWYEEERKQYYGMTWLEWCSYVETHTGSEVLEFRYQYCKTHGLKWPQGPNTKKNDEGGRVIYGPAHPNDLGMNEGKVRRTK